MTPDPFGSSIEWTTELLNLKSSLREPGHPTREQAPL